MEWVKPSVVVEPCMVGSLRGLSSLLQKDWIPVIVDDSSSVEAWHETWNLSIQPCLVPLYFLVLIWSGSHFKDSSALWWSFLEV